MKAYFYVVTNFKDGGDMYPFCHGLTNHVHMLLKKHKPTKPLKREDNKHIDNIDIEFCKEDIKQFVRRKMNLRRNVEKNYGLVWGQ